MRYHFTPARSYHEAQLTPAGGGRPAGSHPTPTWGLRGSVTEVGSVAYSTQKTGSSVSLPRYVLTAPLHSTFLLSHLKMICT
jgi:hypothetical protein